MNNVYVSNIEDIVQLLLHVGGKRTVVIEGDMGIGKSTLLKILKKKLPDHVACYLDGTTKIWVICFYPTLTDNAYHSYPMSSLVYTQASR